ncbi:RF-1 domain [Rhizoctonia solani]|uniref:RF-1 domain n=1 Tax=Rhizoctonia solani TaxID=456999 RepID=A0A8H7M7C3_9AGAM|nr:RF-1 domain [Rhizoctonia solani]
MHVSLHTKTKHAYSPRNLAPCASLKEYAGFGGAMAKLFRFSTINSKTGVEFGESLPLSLEHESIESIEEEEELPVERSDASDVMQSPRYISRGKLMAAHRARMIPELREEDLEEMFVGKWSGGQAINKTSSSVSLIHRPTGIRVQCQATRSREQNRKIARKIMVDKLDQLANPGLSKVEVQQEKVRAKKRQRAKKAKKKAKLKADAGPAESDGN